MSAESRPRLSPDLALLRWTSIWLAGAVLSVPAAGLRPLVIASGALLIALVLADLFLAAREEPIGLERIAPEAGAREKAVEIAIAVHNPLSRAIEVEIRESVPRDLVEPEPGWRSVGVESGQRRTLRYRVRPRVRGRRIWGPVVAQVRSPLGLLRRRQKTGAGMSIRIAPETESFLRPEALDPRTVLASLGVRPRRRRGDGLELDSLREYVIGDEPRRIDWRATARRGRPIVRTHRHEESRTVLLAVDASRLMGTRAPLSGRSGPGASGSTPESPFAPTKLDSAIDAALALAFAGLAAGDRVGLLVFDRDVRGRITPMAHRASLGLFVDALSDVQPRNVEADYRRLSRALLERPRKRALVVVWTDFLEVDEEEMIAPMALLARRHEVVFVALREPILASLEAPAVAGPALRGRDDRREDRHEDRRERRRGGPRGERERLLPIHRRIALADLLRERERRLVALRRRGLSVLDVLPSQATAATLNRFLELRYGRG